MATAFRRKTATGRTSTYYVKWHDSFNATSPRWSTGLKRKDAAEVYGRRLEELAEKRRTGQQLGADLERFIADLDEDALDKLQRLGLLDARHAAASQTLAELVEAYREHRTAKGRNARDSGQCITRIERIHTAAKATRPRDLTLEGIERAISDITTTPATFNAYARVYKAFAAWLVKRGALYSNPLAGLEKAATEDKQHRRALTEDEAQALIAAAEAGETVTTFTKRGVALQREGHEPPADEIAWSVTGPERAMLYRFALETALRASSIAGLTVGDFDLDGDEPGVTIRGETGTKERGRRTLPLMPDTAAMLRERFAAKLPAAPAFNTPPVNRLAGLLRDDLAAARAAWIAEAPTPAERAKRAEADFLADVDAQGRRVDFHALRDTAATWLAKRGVPLTVVMLVTGHKNVSTLQRHYLRHDEDDVRQALKLTHRPEPARATGTADATPREDDDDSPRGGGNSNSEGNRNGPAHGTEFGTNTPTQGGTRRDEGKGQNAPHASKTAIQEAAVGFEPTNRGFAIRSLGPLGHAAGVLFAKLVH